MEREDVLKNLELVAAHFRQLEPHLHDSAKQRIQDIMNILLYLPSEEGKVVINLNEFPQDKAAALREMFGPFKNMVETLASMLDTCLLEGNFLTVRNELSDEEAREQAKELATHK